MSEHTKQWFRLSIDNSNALSAFGKKEIQRFIDELPEEDAICSWDLRGEPGLKMLTPEFLEVCANHGFPIARTLFIYRRPGSTEPVTHTDSSSEKIPLFAVNWVVTEDDDSDMVWFEKNEAMLQVEKEFKETGVHNWPRFETPPSELVENDRVRIGKQLTLIRADTPHIIEVGNNHRMILTLRFSFDKERQFRSWEEVVEHFKDIIVE